MFSRRILPSITTLNRSSSSWREKIREINALGITEVGLFLTGLSEDERKECYVLLEDACATHSFRIPFVHAVASMREEEYHYLMDIFGTEKFNLHPAHEFPLEHPLSAALRKRIFIENTSRLKPLQAEDLEGFGGICFDLSHLEDSRRLSGREYHRLLSLTSRFAVGANHISAVSETPMTATDGFALHSRHLADETATVKYLCGLSTAAFAPLCAVELENSLEEQLSIIPMIHRAFIRAHASAWLEQAA